MIMTKKLTIAAASLGAIALVGGTVGIAYKAVKVNEGYQALDSTDWSLGGQLGFSEKLEKADETNWKRNEISLTDNKVNYLALGDSVAAGYDAWRDIDGYGYPDFINDELSAREKIGTFDRHTFTGITAEDMSSIIQGDMEQEDWDSTLNDHKYTDQSKYQKDGEHISFSDYSTQLDEKIKNANLITLNMGANDIMGGIEVLGISLHDLMNPTFLKKKNLVPESVDSKDAMSYYATNKINELRDKGIPYIIQHINEIINIDKSKLAEIIIGVGGSLNGSLAKIRRLNPTANIVVAGYYNPLVNFGLISQLAGLDGLIENLNTAIKNAAYTQNTKDSKYNVIYTDFSKLTENITTAHKYGSTSKLNSLTDGIYGADNANGETSREVGVNGTIFVPHVLDIHPSLKGSIMMGKLVLNDYAALTHAPAEANDDGIDFSSSFESVLKAFHDTDFTKMKEQIEIAENTNDFKFEDEFIEKFINVYSYDKYIDMKNKHEVLNDPVKIADYEKLAKEYNAKKLQYDIDIEVIKASTGSDDEKYSAFYKLIERNKSSKLYGVDTLEKAKTKLGLPSFFGFDSLIDQYLKGEMFNTIDEGPDAGWLKPGENPTELIEDLEAQWSEVVKLSSLIKNIPSKPSDADSKFIHDLFDKKETETLFQTNIFDIFKSVVKLETTDTLKNILFPTGDKMFFSNTGFDASYVKRLNTYQNDITDFSKMQETPQDFESMLLWFTAIKAVKDSTIVIKSIDVENPMGGIKSIKSFTNTWDTSVMEKFFEDISKINGEDYGKMNDIKYSENSGANYLFTKNDSPTEFVFESIYTPFTPSWWPGHEPDTPESTEAPGYVKAGSGKLPEAYTSINSSISRELMPISLQDLYNDEYISDGKKYNLYFTKYEDIIQRELVSNGNEDDNKKYAGYQIGSVYTNSFQLIAEGAIKGLLNSLVKSLGDFAKDKVAEALETFKTISRESIGDEEWTKYISMQGIYEKEDPLYVLLNIMLSNLGGRFSTASLDQRTLIQALLDNHDKFVIGYLKDGVGLLQSIMSNDNALNSIIYPIKDALIPLMDTNDANDHHYSEALIDLSVDIQGWIYGMNYAENRLDNTRRFWSNIYSFNMLGFNLATMTIPNVGGLAIHGLFEESWADSKINEQSVAKFLTLATDEETRRGQLLDALNDMVVNGSEEEKDFANKRIDILTSFGVNVNDKTSTLEMDTANAGLEKVADRDEINEKIGKYLRDLFIDNEDNGQGIYYPTNIYAVKK